MDTIAIYDALWKLEADILDDLGLSLDHYSIGGMNISVDHKYVELEIRNKAGRFITDDCVKVSEWLS